MEPDSPPDYVVATYEEIRARFGLGGTDQARIKAKRRKWPAEPPNHPGALAQIRVPQKDWDAAGQTERSLGGPAEQSRTTKTLEGITAAFREERDRLLAERDRERERADKAEARADRAEAERDAARAEREAAKVAAASAEGEAKGLRLALEEARRPFWRRWLG
jgi:hypothetical protein